MSNILQIPLLDQEEKSAPDKAQMGWWIKKRAKRNIIERDLMEVRFRSRLI
jgi:hypothetical protein